MGAIVATRFAEKPRHVGHLRNILHNPLEVLTEDLRKPSSALDPHHDLRLPPATPTRRDRCEEPRAPACVMTFNASDPSGAGGIAGDVATIAAMGAHALPVVTTVLMRDSAEVFDQHAIDADAIAEQARTILEDITRGRLEGRLPRQRRERQRGGRDAVGLPRRPAGVLPAQPGLARRRPAEPYLDAFRELILPATEVLVGNHKTLTDFLLPDWDSERPASARELAVAAGEHGTRFVLVTGVMLPAKGSEQFIDNVLASPQGALTGEKFERFEAAFVGAGDTLSAALAALLAAGSELQAAVGEALAFLDQSLDAGFRPGMGNVVPDRFFWALPPAEEGEAAADARPTPTQPTTRPQRQGQPAAVSTDTRTDRNRRPCSNAPSASSPAASTRRCAPSAPSAARRASSRARRAPTCGTPRASATSTTSAPGAR